MKIGLFLTLFATAFSILDRSFYDALGIDTTMKNCQSVPARRRFAKHSELFPRNTIPTETQGLDNVLERSTWVLPYLSSL